MFFDLPEDHPFTPMLRLILALVVVVMFLAAVLVFLLLWYARRLKRSEIRQDRLLLLAEEFAKLGKERREDAKPKPTQTDPQTNPVTP